MRAILTLLAICGSLWADGWALVALLDGTGALSGDGKAHLRSLQESWGGPGAIGLVTGSTVGDKRTLTRWTRDDEAAPWCLAGQGGVSAAEWLSDYLAWGSAQTGDRNLIIVVMGHGLPPCSGGGGQATPGKLLRGCVPEGITGPEMARGMAAVDDRGARRQKVLVLEACYSASLELLWDLRGSVDAVVCAPGAISSPGLPWAQMLAGARGWLPEDGAGVAGALVERIPGDRGALSACDLSSLSQVHDSLRALSRFGLADMASAAAGAQSATAQAAAGQTLRQVCDAGELAGMFAACARTGELKAAAGQFERALEKLVIRRTCAGESSAQMRDRGAAGVTLHLPPALVKRAGPYVMASRLARSTGYEAFVQGYLEYCAGLVPGLGFAPPADRG